MSVSQTPSIESLLKAALAHHQAGRLADAEKLYRDILKVEPRHADAHHQLGVLAVQQGNPALALQCLKTALECNPRDSRHWFSYATALLETGRPQDAIALLTRGQNHGLSGPQFDRLMAAAQQRLNPGTSDADDLHRQAYLQAQAGRLDEAVLLYRRAIAAGAGGEAIHINLGNALAAQGAGAEAALSYRQALALAPANAMAHNNLANVLEQLGDVADAEAAYRSALTALPDYFDSLYNFANFLVRRGQIDPALDFYFKALAVRPDSVEALVNFGNALAERGRLDDAVSAWRRAVALKPDAVEAIVNLRNALTVQFDLDDAQTAYRQALAANSDDVEALVNLAKALTAQGRLEEGIALYRRALTLAPGTVEAEVNLRSALLLQSSFDAVVQSCRTILAAEPGNAEIHFQLGKVLTAQGKLDEALASYGQALQLQPGQAECLLQMGKALALSDRPDDAIAAYHDALAARPDHAETYAALGRALTAQGEQDAAVAAYRSAAMLAPDSARIQLELAKALCEINRIGEAFAAFTRHAELTYGDPQGLPAPIEEPPPHKVLHDREQRDYIAGGKADAEAPTVDSLFRIVDGERLSGPAINPANAAEAAATWRSSRPQVVVIDDLLTPEALEKLRRFCRGSTIWRHVHPDGYVAAFPEHGLASPLLAQIAEELRDTHPAIFGEHPLRYLWAFKYGSRHAGVKLHADTAAINVNFWIAPEEANLAPDRGGLVVWDVSAPLEWDFVKYNGDVPASREFLAKSGARPIRIPHRANRAVIFDSDLFHETDTVEFRDGYLNRRINVTLLYGRRTPGLK